MSTEPFCQTPLICIVTILKEGVRVGGGSDAPSASVSACVSVCVCVKEGVRVGGGSDTVSKCECL